MIGETDRSPPDEAAGIDTASSPAVGVVGSAATGDHLLNNRIFTAIAAASWAIVLVLPQSSTATTPADLCTGNPCVISASATIDPGSHLDFGAAALRIGAGRTLTIGAGAAPRAVSIHAASIVLEPGAQIDGGGDDSHLVLEATSGNFELQSSGASKSKLDLRSSFAGVLAIDASGDALLDGLIDAGAPGPEAMGGLVDIAADGRVTISQKISLDGTGLYGSAGELSVMAGGAIDLNADIFAPGQGAAGAIFLESMSGDVTVAARIDVSGVGADAYGESVDLIARNGSVTLAETGEIKGTGGSGDMEACGDGAMVTFDAALGVTQAGSIDLGGGFQCGGGEITVLSGGTFTMEPGSSSDLTGAGGYGYGGLMTISAGGDVRLGGIKLNSPGSGGTLIAGTQRKITFEGSVDLRGTGTDGFGGLVEVTACEIDLAPSGSIDSSGHFAFPGLGKNLLRASGAMTLRGNLIASDRNELRYKTVAPSITGTVTPSAVLVVDSTLADCAAGCGNGAVDAGELCDDGNLIGCDGCSATCQEIEGVCGDGTSECAEQCDDGNATDGDGCDADCTPTGLAEVRFLSERPIGSCLVQWGLQLGNARINPRTSLPYERQSCMDGDPECDTDGRINQSCQFRARTCVRAPDETASGCSTAAVDFVKLRRPRVDVGSDPIDLANADRIAEALMSLGGDVRSGDRVLQSGPAIETPESCTPQFDLEVPIRIGKSGKRTINMAARGVDGSLMKKNLIRLTCTENDAVCGDGTLTPGEACDDGNTAGCDGCSADCRVESCGDGVAECSEQCDEGDANASSESRCAESCQILPPELRIAGGGPRAADCTHQWSLEVNAATLRRDRNGAPSNQVVCHDGDPDCDFDEVAGSCRLRLWSCSGGEDLAAGCPARPVLALDLTAPHPGAQRPWELLGRLDLLAGLAASPLATPAGESCTPMTEVDLPARQTLRIRIAADAQNGSRRLRDNDKLLLRCED